MVDHVKMEPWFLHEDLALRLLGSETAMSLRFAPASHPFAKSINHSVIAEALQVYISNQEVPNGGAEILAGRLREGQLVWFDEAFWFKGVAKGYEAGRTSGGHFHTKLDVNADFQILGNFNPMRVTASTSLSILTGRSPQFILAYVTTMSGTEISLRPVVIASRMLVNGRVETSFRDRVRLWPSCVTEFKGVDFSMALRKSDLELLREVSEDKVKRAFAEIIGEPEIPKDWGGEQFDLWTDRITVDGERYQAAIAFKGPAKFHPMTIADLGKNGDQIDRLSNTDADLLVVQHCHAVTAPVVNMLRNYAVQPGRRRRYMVIDGYDTIRILRHFEYI
ncbi:hypothetical protein GS456_01085 [Rhodococcus hoagii]|nr:hypothetical protein [Prescottella equi]